MSTTKFVVGDHRGNFVSLSGEDDTYETAYETLSDVLLDAKSAITECQEQLGEYYPEALLVRVRSALDDLVRELVQHELDTKVVTKQRTKA